MVGSPVGRDILLNHSFGGAMKKVGLILLCRYNSSRLPGKILKRVGEKTVLETIYERLLQARGAEEIVVATSVESTDDVIADFCEERQIRYFRGDLEDVASRFLACAQASGFDFAGRVNGDNLFADIPTIQRAIQLAGTDKFDLITNVPGRTFPAGMTVEVVRTSFFQEVMARVDDARLREHVTLHFYENEGVGRRYIIRCSGLKGAQGADFAIDRAEDLERARKMVGRMNRDHIYYHLPDILRLSEEVDGIEEGEERAAG